MFSKKLKCFPRIDLTHIPIKTMSLLELVLEPEIYTPIVDSNGNYIDKTPTANALKYGIRCPCGTRQENIIYSAQKFKSHIKALKHQAWLKELTDKKGNFYEENIKLKDLVHQLRLMNAEHERTLINKNRVIDILLKQIELEKKSINENINLIDF
jgi:hypothetical protein